MVTFIVLSLLIFIGILVYFSYTLCLVVVHPRKKSYEKGYINQLQPLNLQSYYDSLHKESITLKSPYGYKLNCEFIENENSNKCIVICHGITANMVYSIKFIKPFYDNGYSIFIYDQRNHGFSGGKNTSMGYFEKYDLKACVDWVFNKLGSTITLGVLGESMGAATVLQYCSIDDRVDFCIEDCGYSNVFELFKHRFKADYKINFPPILFIADFIMKTRYKWDFKSASPISYIDKLTIPTLFIHGDNDDYVPTRMVYDLFDAKNLGYKELYIAKNAVHADALLSNASEYYKVIENFLKSNKLI